MKIGITHGDINGVGYETILKAFDDPRMLDGEIVPVIYGSTRLANFYSKNLNLQHTTGVNPIARAEDAEAGKLNLIDVLSDENTIAEPGRATKAAGEAALASLEAAVRDLHCGNIDALVTAPINKDTIQCPTFTFPGHTEYLEASLADEAGRDKALMIMASERMRVAFATCHLPLKDVAGALSRERLVETLKLFSRSLTEDYGVSTPRIAVLALNPHAGENGLLGKEEQEMILPAIEEASKQGVQAFGPYASDGFFGSGSYMAFDGVLAMYHDQGLIPFKLLSMDSGVNHTAGLVYVRTSPDHGTAYDIAGKGTASPESMRAAIFSAMDIVNNRRRHAEATANPLPRAPRTDRRKNKEGKEPKETAE